MWREEFRPLSFEIWLDGIEKLVARCSAGTCEEEDRAVRQAYHLARLSPLAIRKIQAPFASESELEDLIDHGEIEQAAKAAIGGKAAVNIADDPNSGRHIANFIQPGDEPVQFEAASPALAIIGAWASFLKTIRRD